MSDTATATTDTTTSKRSEVEMARDRNLHYLSGLVDSVRDTARELLGVDAAQETRPATHALVARYTALRESIADALEPTERERVEVWAPVLNEETTLAAAFDAATALARVVDLYFAADTFVASRIRQRIEIDGALAQASEAYPDAQEPDEAAVTGDLRGIAVPGASLGHGQYL